MASQEEEASLFVDRIESTINTPRRTQINRQKIFIDQGSPVDAEVSSEIQTSVISGSQAPSSPSQKSEMNVEIDGFRETSFPSTERVVTSRVRTVYGRSLSGSTSSSESDHKDLGDVSHEPTFSEDVDSNQRERKTSDSYYISQTYQINAAKSSRTVTTVKSVKFKCSKDIEIGAQGKGDAKENPVGDKNHVVERHEEIIPGGNPHTVRQASEKHVKFEYHDIDQEDSEALEKLKAARENVQQLIETSYMVSDITDVIDDGNIGPELSKQERGSEASTRTISTEESRHQISRDWKSSATTSSSQAINIPGRPDSNIEKPSDLPLEQDATDMLSANRESPPRLAYSPGIAIRSYALEELSEKKSRTTPDRLEFDAKSMRFDEESSEVDLDRGSSVDDAPVRDTFSMPHLRRVDLSNGQTQHSSTRTSTTQDVQMFKLTKVQKVSLPENSHTVSSPRHRGDLVNTESQSKYSQETSQENEAEDDESLDKLVDLESIQIGYKFHDVGMMHEAEGISNPAFDDTDETDSPQVSSSSTETSESSKAPTSMEISWSSQPSPKLKEFLQPVNFGIESQDVTSPGYENQWTVEQTFPELSSTSGSTENGTNYTQEISRSISATIQNQNPATAGVDSTYNIKEKNDSQSLMQKNQPRKSQEQAEWQTGTLNSRAQSTSVDNKQSEWREKISTQSQQQESQNINLSNTDSLRMSSQSSEVTMLGGREGAQTEMGSARSVNIDQATQQIGQRDATFMHDDERRTDIHPTQMTEHHRIISQPTEANTLESRQGQVEMSTPIHGIEMGQLQIGSQPTATVMAGNQNSSQKITEMNVGAQLRASADSFNVSKEEQENLVTEQDVAAQLKASADSLNRSLSKDKEDSLVKVMQDTRTADLRSKASQARKQTPVSITRTFNCSKEFESKLKSQGATLKSETIFNDVYFDNQNFFLTLSDCWLRCRNGKWQFHSNFTKLFNEQSKHEYAEDEVDSIILSNISSILDFPRLADTDTSISAFVQKSGLHEFVRYTTVQKTYALKDMTINIECPEYGFWVGRVTARAQSKAKLHHAVKDIDTFWKTTGVQALKLTGA